MAADFARAKQTAEMLIKRYNITEPSIDPEWIAEKENIRVLYINFPEDVRREISGLYDPTAETNSGRGAIVINQEISAVRKAFTVAHELGHVLLHEHFRNAERVSSIQFRTNSWNKKDKPIEEQEADAFAANLLMPESMVRYYFKKTEDIDLLAALFGVSEASMQYRLQALWLI